MIGLVKQVSHAKEIPELKLTKGRGCACCSAWSELLKRQGFNIVEDTLHPAELTTLKISLGVPIDLISCHTGEIEGYVVEGHVPSKDIRRLLTEKPEAIGLAVAGMPYGSPGMGPEEDREAFDVILFKIDGSRTVFSSYEVATN